MNTRHFNHTVIKFFDVTLRDGLQSIPWVYTLPEKVNIMTSIIAKRRPYAIEVGSIVSPKILPQMADSIKLYKETELTTILAHNPSHVYMLTPTVKSVNTAFANDIKNISIISSVSDAFQKKNINKSLHETKKEIDSIMKIAQTVPNTLVKLYISCISECPISGEISNFTILNEILYYYYVHHELDEICLSDTSGTLQFNTFKYIIDGLIKRNVDIGKISLHLHNQPTSQDNLTTIIKYALTCGIYRYDVSYMPDIGGCSVTMDSKKMHGNLSYNRILDCL